MGSQGPCPEVAATLKGAPAAAPWGIHRQSSLAKLNRQGDPHSRRLPRQRAHPKAQSPSSELAATSNKYGGPHVSTASHRPAFGCKILGATQAVNNMSHSMSHSVRYRRLSKKVGHESSVKSTDTLTPVRDDGASPGTGFRLVRATEELRALYEPIARLLTLGRSALHHRALQHRAAVLASPP
jgi:hypothetical protein